MEIKSLILNDNPEVNERVNNVKRTKPTVTYNVEACSGCDFAISRNTPKTQQLFVVLMSQNQFYIKNRNGETESINPTNMVKFFADMSEPMYLDTNWITAVEKGKNFADYLCKFFNSETASIAKAGMLGASGNLDDDMYKQRMYKKNPPLYKYIISSVAKTYHTDELSVRALNNRRDINFACKGRALPEKAKSIFDRYNSFLLIAENYGIEYGKIFVDEYLMSYLEGVPSAYNIEEVLENTEFQASRLIEYLCYDLPRQGYINWAIDRAVSNWSDVLRMQKVVYGNIREKYPEYLDSFHRKLSCMCNIRQAKIDAVGFEEAVNEMATFEWKPVGERWQIICPKNKEDMIDEANQQQNCLASYVSRVANGTSRIYFLRSSNEKLKDRSIVTIETRDNDIVQVRARNNRYADNEHIAFIKRWAEAKGLNYQGG